MFFLKHIYEIYTVSRAQGVAAETDVDKLAAVHFGSSLPDAYMTALTKLLASSGIDITKYSAALSA